MIAVVWLLLAGSAGGGLYGTGRLLARDDMPLRPRRTWRQQLTDAFDGVCGLLSLPGLVARRLLRGRPGRPRGAHRG